MLCKKNPDMMKTDMMKKLIVTIVVLLIAVFLFMGGCSLVESRVARWTIDFNILPSDSRILYEDGAEKSAHEVARHLSNSMRTVETRQFGKFKDHFEESFDYNVEDMLASYIAKLKNA